MSTGASPRDFGYALLKRDGSFKAGIPSHDNIARVICRLKADEIESAFQSWVSSLIETTGADIIAIDDIAKSK
ncbi:MULTISPECIES: ISAs1 family transposase [unclassified Pseudoalteromonas]|uniref:ISAs1 family transposase n=1 Tax=unclassified Pseudoalteromonas TaxID=194690 RepID=UPI0006936A09|nr:MULTISPECIES: ISAs1 family transposase [unclassified Pseudoalteromonas]